MGHLPKQQSNCTQCEHFYVTWDQHHPYGCKAMGFKSKVLPATVTRQVSGELCLSFTPKNQRKPSL